MNDLGRMQCSEEVVVMGILRVVEEILTQKPTAEVVINSMLPMADLRGGMYPKITDYQDAFAGKIDPSRFARKPVNAKGPIIAGAGEERMLKKKEEDMSEGDEMNDDNVEKNLKKFRKDPRNPILDANRHKVHKYNLFPRNRLPLWTSIHAINEELRKFASKHDRVTFFDATDIFASRVELNRYVLQSDMISIRGHPTVAGYEAWEDAMLTRVKKMLEEEKLETPENNNVEPKDEKLETPESSKVEPKDKKEESDEQIEESEEETKKRESSEEESEEETKKHESSEEDVTAKKDQAKKTKNDGHHGGNHAEAERKGKDPSESGDKSESKESKSGDSKD